MSQHLTLGLGFRSGPWPGLSKVSILFFLNHPEVLGLAGVVWVIVLLQKPSPSTETALTPSHHHHHILVLLGCSFPETLCCFYNRRNGTHSFLKRSAFVLSVHRVFSQKSWGFIKMFSCKPETRRSVPFAWLYSWNQANHFDLVSLLWWNHEHWPRLRGVRPAVVWMVL